MEKEAAHDDYFRDEINDAIKTRGLKDGDWENRTDWRPWLNEGKQRQL